MEESNFSRTPVSGAKTSGKKIKLLVILIIFLTVLAGIIFAAFTFLKSPESSKKEVESAKVIPTAVIEQSEEEDEEESTQKPESSPTKSQDKAVQGASSSSVDKATGLDKSSLTIEILNGSGTAGEASKMSDILKGFGYQISSTGNADNFDYEKVTIKIKSTKSKYLQLLKNDLSEKYSIGESSSDFSGDTDVQIIIGK